jgi:hypothetical protein
VSILKFQGTPKEIADFGLVIDDEDMFGFHRLADSGSMIALNPQRALWGADLTTSCNSLTSFKPIVADKSRFSRPDVFSEMCQIHAIDML